MLVALILPLLFVLSACGFHLAGNKPLSDDLKKVYLDTTIPYSVTEPPIEAQLRAILQRRGAEVAKDPSAEVTTIRLSNLRESRERSEEHTSELQSLMRISYAVFCLKKKRK